MVPFTELGLQEAHLAFQNGMRSLILTVLRWRCKQETGTEHTNLSIRRKLHPCNTCWEGLIETITAIEIEGAKAEHRHKQLLWTCSVRGRGGGSIEGNNAGSN